MISQKQARQFWADLKNNLLAAEGAIKSIIRDRAWEPLGYGSFGAAWNAEMRDVTLASEIRPVVAFYMFQEGYGPEWVAVNIKGIGDKRSALWHDEWADGLPPEAAHRGNMKPGPDETVVETHLRKKPGRPGFVRFEVGATWFQEYKRIAKEMGTTVEEIARAATEEAFASLIKGKRRRIA